ncbi:uncharacterized protein [Haliotis cracherodii]|uniref:uncharacterized protein n=1 Tax=Haliotis cracherodii TaxID=6455 RepID=UPI0039E7C6FB
MTPPKFEAKVTIMVSYLPAMPSFESVKSALYRHRRKTIPALPRSRSAVDIEDKWSETTDGRPFLLFSDGDDDKILAFSTAEQIQAPQEADTLYMDGTFTACPGLWDEVYIIHARVGPTIFPLLFALLPDRQATTYGRLFRQLKTEVQERLNRPLSPSKIQIDFEQAVVSAIETEFPQASISKLMDPEPTTTLRDFTAD